MEALTQWGHTGRLVFSSYNDISHIERFKVEPKPKINNLLTQQRNPNAFTDTNF